MLARFAGRTSWLSVFAFGLTGCLTAFVQNNCFAKTKPRSAESKHAAEQRLAGERGTEDYAQPPVSTRGLTPGSTIIQKHTQSASGAVKPNYYASGKEPPKSSKTVLKTSRKHEPARYVQPEMEYGSLPQGSGTAESASSVSEGKSIRDYLHLPVLRLPRSKAKKESSELVATGKASWYGGDFHGGRTANGERYDMESMTAAHRSLPFGTKVKVTNLENGNECVVRINNRGPYRRGRMLDLSKAAARQLGILRRGICQVKMEVLSACE